MIGYTLDWEWIRANFHTRRSRSMWLPSERERDIKREHARGEETRNKGTFQGDNIRMGIISVYWTRKYNSGSVSALALFFKT